MVQKRRIQQNEVHHSVFQPSLYIFSSHISSFYCRLMWSHSRRLLNKSDHHIRSHVTLWLARVVWLLLLVYIWMVSNVCVCPWEVCVRMSSCSWQEVRVTLWFLMIFACSQFFLLHAFVIDALSFAWETL